ncbi:MAG: septum formation initiator family protein [Bacteroidetes bacterium]|nr:septum formation initiator family protein [Bacteroidota bacterium]
MIKEIIQHLTRFKYLYTLAVFVVWMIFFDQNRLEHSLRLQRNYNALIRQKQYYLHEIRSNQEELRSLQYDTAYMEKVAREKYLMKRPNERIYVMARD